MKNLIDELHNLDNYDYKISTDFSKKVINKIKKDKKLNTFSYVISFASLGIVACLAFVLITNVDTKDYNLYAVPFEETNGINNEYNYAMQDNFNDEESIDTDNTDTYNIGSNNIDFETNKKVEMASENDNTNINTINYSSNISKENLLRNVYVSGDSIIKMLENAKYEIDEMDNFTIKVKAKIQDVEELLDDIKSQITIYEEDDYTIIKLKN